MTRRRRRAHPGKPEQTPNPQPRDGGTGASTVSEVASSLCDASQGSAASSRERNARTRGAARRDRRQRNRHFPRRRHRAPSEHSRPRDTRDRAPRTPAAFSHSTAPIQINQMSADLTRGRCSRTLGLRGPGRLHGWTAIPIPPRVSSKRGQIRPWWPILAYSIARRGRRGPGCRHGRASGPIYPHVSPARRQVRSRTSFAAHIPARLRPRDEGLRRGRPPLPICLRISSTRGQIRPPAAPLACAFARRHSFEGSRETERNGDQRSPRSGEC